MSQPTGGRCRTGLLRAHGDMVKKFFFKKSKNFFFQRTPVLLWAIPVCGESMRFFAIVLRFALKEIWPSIEAKNRYFSAHRYCSEQYRFALKNFFSKNLGKKIFFSNFFLIFIFVHMYILPPTGQRYGLKVVTGVL